MRTATHRAFSIPIKFATRFETLRLRRIAKRCSIAGAAKALFNASTGSSRSCRRRLKKSFGCRPRNFRHLKFANTDRQATALLDGHLEAAPRKSGSLREAYVVSDFEHLEKEIDPNQRLIVTIDLDYFAGLAAAEQEQAFARIWNFVIEQPNLRAITFAISRP